MPRENLISIENVRDSFSGKFERVGGKGGKKLTILLVDIVNTDGEKLCDHAWLKLGKQCKDLGWLTSGSVVCFNARVKKYRKGSIKRNIPVEYDYKFTYPSKIYISS